MAGSVQILPPIKRNSISVILRVKIYDTASTVGHAGKTGLAYNSSGLLIAAVASSGTAGSASTFSAGSNTVEDITTLGTYATPTSGKCRFKEVSSTNFPGLYELQLPNSLFGTGKFLSVSITSSVSGHGQCDLLIPLTDFDPYDPIRGGLEALPYDYADGVAGIPSAASLPSVVWQPLLSGGEFGISGSIGKLLKDAIPNAVAGASGGLMILGTNNGTLNITDGVVIGRTTTNGHGLQITGNGTGSAIVLTGGATSGSGIYCVGSGTGYGIICASGGGASGDAVRLVANSTSGSGLVLIASGNSNGLVSLGGSSHGNGAYFGGGGAGSGIYSVSGLGATGDGATFVAASTNGHGMNLTSTGAGKKLNAVVEADVVSIVTSTTAAAALKALHDSVETGTCQSGSTSTTIKLATAASSTDDFYTGSAVVVTSATGAKQVRKITAYVGSTRVATVDAAWVSTPDATSIYAILGRLV